MMKATARPAELYDAPKEGGTTALLREEAADCGAPGKGNARTDGDAAADREKQVRSRQAKKVVDWNSLQVATRSAKVSTIARDSSNAVLKNSVI
jgi:hypothetical protein